MPIYTHYKIRKQFKAFWRYFTGHSDGNNVTKQTALTEKGEAISGRGDAVNTHDILTGSDPAGNYSTAGCDTTCGNWTKSGDGSAIVGHHDRIGLKDTRHHEVVEHLPRNGRLQPGGPAKNRRQRAVLLLRRRLTTTWCGLSVVSVRRGASPPPRRRRAGGTGQ